MLVDGCYFGHVWACRRIWSAAMLVDGCYFGNMVACRRIWSVAVLVAEYNFGQCALPVELRIQNFIKTIQKNNKLSSKSVTTQPTHKPRFSTYNLSLLFQWIKNSKLITSGPETSKK
jgi:hypothetical protein